MIEKNLANHGGTVLDMVERKEKLTLDQQLRLTLWGNWAKNYVSLVQNIVWHKIN